MNIKSVRVGPFDIRIGLLAGKQEGDYLGLFEIDKLLISLRKEYPSEQQRAETLLHELLHAAYHVYNCKPRMEEEQMVHQLSLALACMIRDNPELVTYLQDSLKCG